MRHLFVSRPQTSHCHSFLAIAFFACALLLGASVLAADPRPAVATRLPEKGLVAYLEYDGLRSHAKAWENTAAGAILQRTQAGAMATELMRQVLDEFLKNVPDTKVKGAELLRVLQDLSDEGFAVALYMRDADSGFVVVVGKGLGASEARQRLEKLGRALSGGKDKSKPALRRRGREIFPIGLDADDAGNAELIKTRFAVEDPDDAEPRPAVVNHKAPGDAILAESFQAYWFEGNDLFLIMSSPDAADAEKPKDEAGAKEKPKSGILANDLDNVLDAFEGKGRTAANHEGYLAALAEAKDLDGFDANGLFFLELGGKNSVLKNIAEGAGAVSPFAMRSPYTGLTLPSGKYMHDDVQYFPPAGVFPTQPTNLPTGPARPAQPVNSRSSHNEAQVPCDGPEPIHEKPVPPKSGLPEPQVPLGPRQANVKTIEAPNDAQKADKEDPEKEIDELELLGLYDVKRVVARWGFQGKGLLTVVRVEIPKPRKGLWTILDAPGFRKDQLPPIPRGVTSFVIGSFDPARAYEAVVNQIKAAVPETGPMIEMGEAAVREAIGLRLREDLLANIGPTWCTFDLAEGPKDLSKGLSRGQALVVGLHDADAFAKVLDKAAVSINATLKTLENGPAADKPDAGPPVLAFEPLPKPERGYQLTSPAGLVVWLGDETRPTILIGKYYAVVAINPELARAVLAAESKPGASWQSQGELTRTLAGLPAELTSLSVTDAIDSLWPETMVKLPAYVQLLGNLISASAAGDEAPASTIQLLAGIPSPSGFRVRIDPAKLPKAKVVREFLFPSALATVVDDRGLRWIGREAFPFASISGSVPIKPKFKIDLTQPAGNRLKMEFDVFNLKTN